MNSQENFAHKIFSVQMRHIFMSNCNETFVNTDC